jgi:outer membrane protein assembly factor BamB
LSDGTATGTAPLLDAGGHQILAPQSLRTFAGYLVYDVPVTGSLVLWQNDGTPSGAAPVLTVSPPYYNFGNDLVVAGDRLYLGAYNPATGDELWALQP